MLAMEGDRGWTPLLASEASEREPHISPDGKWIAYSSNETGQYVIYVERFPELGARQPISTGLGLQPLWSPDGGELFYVGAESALMAVPVEMGETLTAGTPEELFRWPLLSFVALPGRQHDITSSGDRFLPDGRAGHLDWRLRDHHRRALVRGARASRAYRLMAVDPGTALGRDEVSDKQSTASTDRSGPTRAGTGQHAVSCSPVQDEGWGLLTRFDAPWWWSARHLSTEACAPGRGGHLTLPDYR